MLCPPHWHALLGTAFNVSFLFLVPSRRHGHTAVMEVLLQHGAKAGTDNKQGLTALGAALVGGQVAAAKLLQR